MIVKGIPWARKWADPRVRVPPPAGRPPPTDASQGGGGIGGCVPGTSRIVNMYEVGRAELGSGQRGRSLAEAAARLQLV